MRAHHQNLRLEVLEYEIHLFRRQLLDAFLDNMVSVLVFHAFHQTFTQLDYHFFLHIKWQAFQRFLDNPTPVHLEGERAHLATQLVAELSHLILVGVVV